MSDLTPGNRLDRPVNPKVDHILGPIDAPITLVEYGSYACPYCRAANERISKVRDELGDRLRYVFRHKPLAGNPLARPAAELVERADSPERFWDAHIKLMTRSEVLTRDDLVAVAADLGVEGDTPDARAIARASARVDADEESARASGASITPTFFINGRRYDGPWDDSAFGDAMIGTLGHRFRAAALDFVSWGPSAGALLLLATILAIAIANTDAGPAFTAFWEQRFGLTLGGAGFAMSLRGWIDDGLLTVFFLVVGLEIKREFTVGRLSGWRSAALPVAGSLGGMIAPALLYLAVIPSGPWSHGWGVVMSTDTAFAIALIAMLGARVPVELRIFLTAAAIVDDLVAIVAVAAFYSGELRPVYLAAAIPLVGALAMLNRSHVYILMPYVAVGAALWACVLASGLHPTLAGVILALFIPTRPPANLKALMTQANVIVSAEAERVGEVLQHGPSLPSLRALDDIHDRIEFAGGSPVEKRGCAIELSGAAAVCAGQRRRRDDRGRSRRTRAPDGGGRRRAHDRQAARDHSRLRARGPPQSRGQAGGIFMGAARGRGRAGRDRLHHVALHRRPGLRCGGGFRSRKNRDLGRFRPVRGHRRDGAVVRGGKDDGMSAASGGLAASIRQRGPWKQIGGCRRRQVLAAQQSRAGATTPASARTFREADVPASVTSLRSRPIRCVHLRKTTRSQH